MNSRSISPAQPVADVGPINEVRVGTTAPTRVETPLIRSTQPGPERPTPGDADHQEVHVNGAARRAYAQFMAHPETGQVSIKIIDADTKQVVREIPSEEVIRLAAQLQSYWEARTKKVEAR